MQNEVNNNYCVDTCARQTDNITLNGQLCLYISWKASYPVSNVQKQNQVKQNTLNKLK